MQIPYRTVAFEDIDRLVSWCQANTKGKEGVFEVYEDPGGINRIMVVVNSAAPQDDLRMLKPLGSFYCNYIGPGVISLDEGPEDDGLPPRYDNIEELKRIIDRLLKDSQL